MSIPNAQRKELLLPKGWKKPIGHIISCEKNELLRLIMEGNPGELRETRELVAKARKEMVMLQVG